MATALHGNIVFGPVKSRRLGLSLGVNLLPVDNKLCNFNCIYCECGWNYKISQKLQYPSMELVCDTLCSRLEELNCSGVKLDVITFAGNGEPTMHPDFAQIIDRVISLRDRLASGAKIAVLTNATLVARDSVRHALERVDRAILKIDSGFQSTIEAMNLPAFDYSLSKVISAIKSFKGDVIIQTMFLRGEYNGVFIDNTTPEQIAKWLEVIKEIAPSQVMVYSIDRDTPAENLEKIPLEKLQEIAAAVRELSVECSVA